MAKKPKKSLAGKSSFNKKAKKPKLSGATINNDETEEIKSVFINDDLWQCTIVLLVLQSQSLYDFILRNFVDLPKNITVVTKDSIASKKEQKSKSERSSKTRKSSSRSPSKSSKKSSKVKTVGKSKTKQENVEVATENLTETASNEINSTKVGLALKRAIINLRSTDITNKNITENTFYSIKSDLKKRNFKRKSVSKDYQDETLKYKEITGNEEKLTNENVIHRFIILLGFHEPLLPEVCSKWNVPIRSIINVINIGDYGVQNISTGRRFLTTAKSKRKSNIKSKKESVDEKLSYDYLVFLDYINKKISNSQYLEENKHTIFLKYSVKDLHAKDKDGELKHKTDMLGLFYKIKESWDQYQEYRRNIQVQNIPIDSERLTLEEAKIYCTMTSMVPLECTSIAVILHCILEQIYWWGEDRFSSGNTDVLDNNLESSNTRSNDFTSSDSIYINKNITPILILNRDKIKRDSFHLNLPEFDFEQISRNIFMKLPVYKLWERYPPQPEPVKKWYEFQLQKLRECSDNFTLEMNNVFSLYLHSFIMDVLILKSKNFLNSNIVDSAVSKQGTNENNQIFLSGKELVNDSNSNIFITDILNNLLYKVPQISKLSIYRMYSNFFEVAPYFSLESIQKDLFRSSLLMSFCRVDSLREFKIENNLQKKEYSKLKKLNKLASFLYCSEFVNLYDDIIKAENCEGKHLAKYEFIEKLNIHNLCQCLQEAFQTFKYINYDYFPVCDSILLWFNNTVENEIVSSCSRAGVLETPLGFRDYYVHKLRESVNLGDSTENIVDEEDSEENQDSFLLEKSDDDKSVTESLLDSLAKNENSDKSFKINTSISNPLITYDLGSLRLESTDLINSFCSVDSSSVSVTKANFFNKSNIIVNIRKNNMCLGYELDPESSNEFVELFIDVPEKMHLNIILKWDDEIENLVKNNVVEPEDNLDNVRDFNVKCSLSLSLPSGLLIEVVPTNSTFGPFYVRQRYLGKGPTCSNIWEEAYRCYFNNGMTLIFRLDSSVDILYNNGTVVKCHSLEMVCPNILTDTKENKPENNLKKNPRKSGSDDLKPSLNAITKKEVKNQQKNKGKVKSESTNGKKTKKLGKNDQKNKGSKISTDDKEENFVILPDFVENIPLYNIIKHSVVSWDGELSHFEIGNCIDRKKSFSLRTAFDDTNHELYWQRSDGMKCLQTPENLEILFPDGSKITSFSVDKKELNPDTYIITVQDHSRDSLTEEGCKDSQSANNDLDGGEFKKNNFDKDQTNDDLNSVKSSINSFDEGNLKQNTYAYIETNYTMQHINYARVEYWNDEGKLKLVLPGDFWLTIDEMGLFSFKSDTNEKVHLFKDCLIFKAIVLSDSLDESTTTLSFENVDSIPRVFSKTVDSFGNFFSVDERGNTTFSPLTNGASFEQQSSCLHFPKYPHNTERLFVFKRDLTGYELIQELEHENTLNNSEIKIVNTPLIKHDDNLYCFYAQAPVYRSKSEEYIMHDVRESTTNPSLIKRKDLLKTHQTPETIWFYPKTSTVTKLTEIECTAPQVEKHKAMIITERLKVKKKGVNLTAFFLNSLTKYMEINNAFFQKYLSFYPKESRKEEELIECENHKIDFLGSQSYYLTDNLPVVVTGDVDKNKQEAINMFDLFSPFPSKMSL